MLMTLLGAVHLHYVAVADMFVHKYVIGEKLWEIESAAKQFRTE